MVDGFKTQLDATDRELYNLSEENKGLNGRVAQYGVMFMDKVQELQHCTKEKTDATHKLERRGNAIKHMLAKLCLSHMLLKARTTHEQRQEHKAAELERRAAELEHRAAELQQMLGSSQSECKRLKSHNQSLSDKLGDSLPQSVLRDAIKRHEQELARQKASMDAKVADTRKAAERALAEQKEQTNNTRMELEALLVELKAKTEDCDKLEVDLNASSQALYDLQQNHAVLQNEYKDLDAKYKVLDATYKAFDAAYKKDMEEAERQVADMSKDRKALLEALERQSMTDVHEDLRALMRQNTALQAHIVTKQDRLGVLEQMCTQSFEAEAERERLEVLETAYIQSLEAGVQQERLEILKNAYTQSIEAELKRFAKLRAIFVSLNQKFKLLEKQQEFACKIVEEEYVDTYSAMSKVGKISEKLKTLLKDHPAHRQISEGIADIDALAVKIAGKLEEIRSRCRA